MWHLARGKTGKERKRNRYCLLWPPATRATPFHEFVHKMQDKKSLQNTGRTCTVPVGRANLAAHLHRGREFHIQVNIQGLFSSLLTPAVYF